MGVNDYASGQGQSRRRRGSGRGGRGRQQMVEYVQVWGFKMPWRLQSNGQRMDGLWAAKQQRGDGGANGAQGGRRQWPRRRRIRRRRRPNDPSIDFLRCSVHREDSRLRRRDGNQREGNYGGIGSRRRRGGGVSPEGTSFLVSLPCRNILREQRQRWGRKRAGVQGGQDIKSKTITCSPLPQKYGNLTLPSSWGNSYGNFACFYYQKLP